MTSMPTPMLVRRPMNSTFGKGSKSIQHLEPTRRPPIKPTPREPTLPVPPAALSVPLGPRWEPASSASSSLSSVWFFRNIICNTPRSSFFNSFMLSGSAPTTIVAAMPAMFPSFWTICSRTTISSSFSWPSLPDARPMVAVSPRMGIAIFFTDVSIRCRGRSTKSDTAREMNKVVPAMMQKVNRTNMMFMVASSRRAAVKSKPILSSPPSTSKRAAATSGSLKYWTSASLVAELPHTVRFSGQPSALNSPWQTRYGP
mmetsp:Transcript_5826/g.16868  ORF Transcript_5826/g.16868 Transcript_5826/m.16868 type:complete len:257 (+) Transcript_5826:1188-1958(+)